MTPDGRVQAWYDGSCSDDGHISFGFIVAQDHHVVFSGSGFHGVTRRDPQVAELAGLIATLRWLAAHGITRAKVYGDCSGMIATVAGRTRRVLPRHRAHVDEARALLAQLPNVKLVWVARSFNANANALATRARENYATLERWGNATNDRRTRPTRKKATGLRRWIRRLLARICETI